MPHLFECPLVLFPGLTILLCTEGGGRQTGRQYSGQTAAVRQAGGRRVAGDGPALNKKEGWHNDPGQEYVCRCPRAGTR